MDFAFDETEAGGEIGVLKAQVLSEVAAAEVHGLAKARVAEVHEFLEVRIRDGEHGGVLQAAQVYCAHDAGVADGDLRAGADGAAEVGGMERDGRAMLAFVVVRTGCGRRGHGRPPEVERGLGYHEG
jgi:hypothetical protein